MNNLDTIIEMRNTLTSIKESLTPYSGKVEHQRYLDNLKHFKQILNANISRLNDDIDKSIMNSYNIIKNYIITDIGKIKTQIENGTR
jgi:uncharacterized protein YktA (UPF0223 family)